MQRTLIILGAICLAAGFLWPWLGHIGLGRLPGDIAIERPNFRLYFPVVTCLLISVVVTLLIWLFRK
jgi:Protein of unknown function (DUF2905)